MPVPCEIAEKHSPGEFANPHFEENAPTFPSTSNFLCYNDARY